MDLGLQGKVAIVGAASKGIGRACAQGLAAEGAKVVICSRNQEEIERAASEIAAATGSEVVPVVADLATAEGVNGFVGTALERFGQIDVTICNTGGPPMGNFWDVDEQAWRDAFELVQMSAIRLLWATVPGMRERQWGRILTIQSRSVKEPLDNLILSNGIRPSVAGIFKSLVADLAKDNITINTVLPGTIMSARITAGLTARAEKAGITFDEVAAQVAAGIPLKRVGTTEEFANAVVFLASEPARYITGTVVQVDGGLLHGIF
ncbi:MAG: SDR family oxidoreductase [Actinobacteria bacterium]|nr:SDR family oxidoreductase [Actinomycetota bacterium]